MEHEPWPTLDQYIAMCIRRYREEKGMRAEDFARLAQRRGLRWNRSTVTAIERGKRKVSAGELIALAAAVPPEGLTSFLDHPRQSIVQLADDVYMDTGMLAGLLERVQGDDAKMMIDFATANALASVPDREIDGMGLIRQIAAGDDSFEEAVDRLSDAERFVVGTHISEADRRAGQRFGVSGVIVTLAGHALWGHGLETERDIQAKHGSKGHTTRELYKALEIKIADRR